MFIIHTDKHFVWHSDMKFASQLAEMIFKFEI